MLEGPYLTLYRSLSRDIPEGRLFHDPLRTLAYGSDASFYRMVPRLVVQVESEGEVTAVIGACRRLRTPMTFRAAGTSLAGQAVTDSVMVQLGPSWKNIRIGENASRVSLQPGVVGAHANARLLPFGRKIGPDPASIDAAMIGGIVANNSSGMCCGTAQNSYKTLAGMRVILADGSLLDTNDPESREAFRRSHADLLGGLSEVAAALRRNSPLSERVRRKYKLKNTTGYSLNALIDFEDPIEILQHLMVGSEGTLGFLSDVTFHTVPEHPHKATALIIFPDIGRACQAIPPLKRQRVAAAEVMDRASLRSVETRPGMPEYLRELGPDAAALLVETRAADSATLHEQMEAVARSISHLPTVLPIRFTTDDAEFSRLWNIRKGLYPSSGAVRPPGTIILIEDVAVPVEVLDRATLELQALLQRYGHERAIIFGHALEGNLHFLLPLSFKDDAEIERFGRFTDDLCRMVVDKYDGSLKAEHGTGRQMAPYVEMEWGSEARALMKQIKGIFDPDSFLNPGVILNDDPQVHLKNLKPTPVVHPLVDKCVECGFCELSCPSKNLSLTPRQRIVVQRELSRLAVAGGGTEREKELRRLYRYYGNETCATDGLCALSCPVEIDTGALIKRLRSSEVLPAAERAADWIAGHMSTATSALRFTLNALDGLHRLAGSRMMRQVTAAARALSMNRLPAWNPAMPKGAQRIGKIAAPGRGAREVVYFPSCVSRSMGPSRQSLEPEGQITKMVALLHKAGWEVRWPARLDELCCGMAFASKGFSRQAEAKLRELEQALLEASRGGALPVLFDTSPCLWHWRQAASARAAPQVFEPVSFISRFLCDRLIFRPLPRTVALHVTCSARKMGLLDETRKLAELCAERVIIPESIGCCGFAGDRGFTVPELNASALRELKSELPLDCDHGYSTSRTCEIGMSLHSDKVYESIVYLVDAATAPMER